MSEALFINNEIEIASPTAVVWDHLSNPEKTVQYMYGCRIVSDLKPGSQIDWVAEVDGKKITYVTGKVVEFQPDKLFSYTVFDPFSDIEDIPENHLLVTYQLEASPAGTKLHVSQGNYATVANGAERYAHSISEGGWQSLLETIKAQVETGI